MVSIPGDETSDARGEVWSPRPTSAQPAPPPAGWSSPPAAAWPTPLADAWQPPVRDTSHNWMGVVALVTGIMGMLVFAFIFGILGLNAARRGQADNKMMSIGGMVIASMYLLIIVFAVVLSGV